MYNAVHSVEEELSKVAQLLMNDATDAELNQIENATRPERPRKRSHFSWSRTTNGHPNRNDSLMPSRA
jgi:hypothetical protein